ncbi:MAG: hypothetical protein GX061_02650 [Eubacteriaceae bacterium]|nr:hypothetical protein [Eubacteriaceae bacterium]
MSKFIRKKTKKTNNAPAEKPVEAELNNEELEREAGYTAAVPNVKKETARAKKAPRSKKRHRIKKKWVRVCLTVFVIIFGICFVGGMAGLGIAMTWMSQAPALDSSKFEFVNATRVMDVNDSFYQELQTSEMRDPVTIDEVPELVQLAFVSIEDQRFFSHFGVDVRGTAKAIIQVLLTRSTSGSGGSTITQQLIKLTHLTSETSIKRKVMEWKLAYEFENRYSKRFILETYLNKINLSYAWGIQSACKVYFGLSSDELTVAQAAILASIMKAPTYYNPYVYEKDADGNTFLSKTTNAAGQTVALLSENNKERAILVVDKMRELGHISKAECDLAVSQLTNNEVGLIPPQFTSEYTYFTDAVYNEVLEDLMEKYSLTSLEASDLLLNGGLTIYSTVDTDIQTAMETQAADDKRFPEQSTVAKNASKAMSAHTGEEVDYIPQVGGVVIQNKTGYVSGIIGGRDKEGNLTMNRGLQKVQVGSSTKPLTCYAPALEEKVVTAATMFMDVPLSFGGWKPGDSGACKGLISLRTGLSNSVNIVAVQVENALGFEKGAEYGEKFGLDIIWDNGYDINAAALALGGYTYGQTPLAMADAYTVFPNGGYRITPTFYRYVTDSEGNIILESSQETIQVISEQTAWLVTDIMKDVVKGGTTTLNVSGQEIAGKTGTTDKKVLAWFCGFTSEYSGAFWFGYDVQKLTVEGSTYNLRIGVFGGSPATSPAHFWQAVFNQFHKSKNIKSASLPSRPGGLFSASIDGASGKIPSELSELDPRGSKIRTEYFLDGTYPADVDDVHVEVDICEVSGLLATAGCPCSHSVRLYIDPEKWFVYGGKEYKDYTIKNFSEYLVPKDTCTLHTASSSVSSIGFGLSALTTEEIINSGSTLSLTAGGSFDVYVKQLKADGSISLMDIDPIITCSDTADFSYSYAQGKITITSLNRMSSSSATFVVSRTYNPGTTYEYFVTSYFTVSCVSESFTITSVAYNTAGGEVNGGTITPTGTYAGGSSVTYSITPNEGYRIAGVQVDGVEKGVLTSYEFTDLNADHMIMAAFEAIPTEPEEPEDPTQEDPAPTP